MNDTILKRTRLWTALAGSLLSLVSLLVVSPRFAAGLLATVAWAVIGFWVLERLVRVALVPPGTPRNAFALVAWGAAKLAVYALAIAALVARPFPPASHLVGFSLLLVVLVVVGVLSRPRQSGQPTRRG